MIVARVIRRWASQMQLSTCVDHQNNLKRLLTTKCLPPEHASSATWRTSNHTYTKIKPRTPRRKAVSFKVGSLFTEDSQELSETDREPDEFLRESENDGVEPTTRFANSVVLTGFKSKLASYDGFIFTHEQWGSFEKDVCAENVIIKKSWPALCMGLMLHFGCLQLASSLMDYLYAHETHNPSITTLSQYIALQGRHGTENREQVISDCYQRVTEISEVFDGSTGKFLIWGLACTSRWRETLDILEMIKLTVNPGPAYYSPIIQAAFREGETELGFKLLDELALSGHQPQNKVVQEMLQVCKATGSNALIDRYLNDFVRQYLWCLPSTLAADIEYHFTSSQHEKWTCKWTEVDTVRGTCAACKQDLPCIELSSADFEAMQREFLERVLVGDNIYLKSNPLEMETFCDFVQENAPFDVVLDALNVALSNKQLSQSRQVREMVHYFARVRHMRVLVLGRAHISKWPDMKYIQRLAKTFLTDNISADDPFCLYATLYSGKDCLFVSRDFMRNHKFNMGLRFKEVFERWQKSRQIFHFWVEHNKVTVKMPSQYDCGPLRNDKGWHIPYDNGNLRPSATTQSVLCLRFRGQKTPGARRKRTKIDKET